MTHAELVTTALSVHGTGFFPGLLMFYRYGDRREYITKSLSGTSSMLRNIRRKLSDELAKHLEPVFDNPGTTIRAELVDQAGNPLQYGEENISAAGTEAYREAFGSFFEQSSKHIDDLLSAKTALRRWTFWARYLSWMVFFELAIAGIFGAVVFLLEKVIQYNVKAEWLIFGIGFNVFWVLACLLAFPFLLLNHDIIMRCMQDHDDV